MDLRSSVCRFVLCFLCLGAAVGVPLRLFYPYGEPRGDQKLPKGDDISSSEVQLETPIIFYEKLFYSLFVNSNGHLSFGSELPGYQPTMVLPLGLEVQIMAAFLSDIDISQRGDVFFRETSDKSLIQRAAADVQGHFSQFPTFEPTSVFIATWDGVGAYSDSSSGNTFQIVIATDGLDSFACFHYLDDGIKWITSPGKFSSVAPDPPGQAGFDSGSGNVHTKLPHSGTPDVVKLSTESNVNVPGVWMYQIGNLKGSQIASPDINIGDGGVVIFEPEVAGTTCLEGSSKCHSNARCLDYDTGFCCECIPPSIGNGYQCLDLGQPQRLNGKVSGVLNGVTFSSLDMHSFVVTKDGRAYTAISRVPPEIGSQMVTLNTIGGIIGWLFSLPESPGAKNGFMFTGGTFNRSAHITYQAGGTVNIRQQFYGHDTLNTLRMDTYINGTVPSLVNGEKVTINDYKEEYRRVAPGRILSRSDRTYRVNDIASQYTWEQVITFDECTLDPGRAVTDTMRMSVNRNFVVYDSNDRVVRFAMSNRIGVVTGTDPCHEGASNCDPFANCISGLESFTCECKSGYFGDGFTCSDIDECDIGLSTCDINAVCLNIPGSFQCRCNQDFRGDGFTCIRDVTLCGDSICGDHSRCVFNGQTQQPQCECESGFSLAEDLSCRAIVFSCNEVDICDENAQCSQDQSTGEYYCECHDGFSGDGEDCESVTIDGCGNCDPNAYCEYDTNRLVYRCYCKEGYTGTGQSCAVISIPECDDCHPYADCVFDDVSQRHGCRCKPGYQGDGTRCIPALDCRQQDNCDVNAQCYQETPGQYSCQCNQGYRGNGFVCVAEDCRALRDCGNNAQCVPDPRDTSVYMCRCDPGYEGDGKVCIQRIVPCNQVNNCSPNGGECVYNPGTLTYSCRCGRGYEGDGFRCRARGVDCHRDQRLCDPNASCELNVDTFMCVCNQGYRGDGSRCSAVASEMTHLIFSRGYSISKVPFNEGEVDAAGTRILYLPDQLAIGVASDCFDRKFYWTDVFGGKVSRASLDGLETEVLTEGFSSPEGIAIDWLSRNMYVTDSGLDVIAVATVNGTYKKTLISDDVVNPRGIVVDPQRGVMYWTDWYRDNPTIEKANMDGSDRQVFVQSELGLPNGLTIDYATQQICWGDAGVNRIECVRSDGVGRRVVTEDAPYPFDVTFYGNTIYWSDWTINGVPSIHRNGGDTSEPLTLPIGGNGRMYGLTAVGDYCPRVTNACYRSNGGCRYLCLPTPNGGRTCVCPDDVDEITCQEIGIVRKKK